MPMTAAAIGVFAAPATTPTKPQAAENAAGRGRREARPPAAPGKKEGDHVPAAPASLQRDDRRDDLPQEREDHDRPCGGERVLDRRDPEPRVRVTDEGVKGREKNASGHGDDVRVLLEAPEAALEPSHPLDQEERDEAEDGSEEDRQADELGAPEPAEPFGKGGHGRPRAAHEGRDDAGHETGEKDRVLNPPEVEHLDPEKGAGNWRPEDGREAAADAADHEAATVAVVEAEDVREQIGRAHV